MAIHKLSAAKVDTLAKAAREGKGERNGKKIHGDGGGLWLQVDGRSVSWIFRYKRFGKSHEMGLGPMHTIGLADARAIALASRRVLLAGGDPIATRDAERANKLAAAAKVMTFDQCAEAYIAAHEVGWKNPVHRKQWRSTLAAYASPIIGKMPIAAIDTAMMLKVLQPIWTTKPETAGRVRGRIESILAWATVQDMRKGENPARWKGHLDQLLPARGKVRKVKHHTALAYADMPAFWPKLGAQPGVAARALEFVILTAVRTGDIIGNNREDRPPMKWEHVDLGAKVWTVPKTKTDVEHMVPLSDAAVAVLATIKAMELGADIVFSSPDRPGEPLSNGAMLALLDRMGPKYEALTAHGFRATFKSWASDQTNFAREVVEAALAHTISDALERAYRRTDFFDKRRRLMAAWSGYATRPAPTGKGENVVPIRATDGA